MGPMVTLRINTAAFGAFLAVFGSKLGAAISLEAVGNLHRADHLWQFDSVRGKLADDTLTGRLLLTEGTPDALEASLEFNRLNLEKLIGDAGAGPMSLRLDPKAMRLQAHISAAKVDYHALHFEETDLQFGLADGQAEVGNLSFGIYGGEVHAAAIMRSEGDLSRITGDVTLSRADIGLIARQAGAKPGDVGGGLGGQITFDMQGATLPAALKASNGHAAVGMTNGRVARSLLELASADLRSLVRHGEGSVPVRCLLAVLDVRNGVGRMAPLRLRTDEATLVGGGSLDLSRQALDLAVQTEHTSLFALDVPIRIVGPIQKPAITPAVGKGKVNAALGLPAGLPSGIQKLAAANPCSR